MNTMAIVQGSQEAFKVWMTAKVGLLSDNRMGANLARAARIKTVVIAQQGQAR